MLKQSFFHWIFPEINEILAFSGNFGQCSGAQHQNTGRNIKQPRRTSQQKESWICFYFRVIAPRSNPSLSHLYTCSILSSIWFKLRCQSKAPILKVLRLMGKHAGNRYNIYCQSISQIIKKMTWLASQVKSSWEKSSPKRLTGQTKNIFL